MLYKLKIMEDLFTDLEFDPALDLINPTYARDRTNSFVNIFELTPMEN